MTVKTIVAALLLALALAPAARAASPSRQTEGRPSQRLMAQALSVAVGIGCPGCEVGELQRLALGGEIAHWRVSPQPSLAPTRDKSTVCTPGVAPEMIDSWRDGGTEGGRYGTRPSYQERGK